jgi:hypothetical protein
MEPSCCAAARRGRTTSTRPLDRRHFPERCRAHPFVVNGAAHASDPALVTASDEMKWLNGILLASTFAKSLTSPPAMPARAWCDMRGETGFVVSLLLQLQENGWRPEQSTYGI